MDWKRRCFRGMAVFMAMGIAFLASVSKTLYGQEPAGEAVEQAQAREKRAQETRQKILEKLKKRKHAGLPEGYYQGRPYWDDDELDEMIRNREPLGYYRGRPYYTPEEFARMIKNRTTMEKVGDYLEKIKNGHKIETADMITGRKFPDDGDSPHLRYRPEFGPPVPSPAEQWEYEIREHEKRSRERIRVLREKMERERMERMRGAQNTHPPMQTFGPPTVRNTIGIPPRPGTVGAPPILGGPPQTRTPAASNHGY